MNNEVRVEIDTVHLSYPIMVESESIDNLKNKILQRVGTEKFLVVISKKVEKIYGKKLGFAKDEKFVLPDGEKEKNFKNYQKILEKAQKMHLSRKSTIIAIGGGVVGDLAAFVASTYMRGCNLIQVPTTLLAMVDSSVGGKTGIDTEFGKNIVGTFYQPDCVLVNPNFIKTLDNRQFMTGMAEVLKYAFIEKSCKGGDFNLFDFLNVNREKILARDTNFLEMLITSSLYLKSAVVSQDEHEGGLRKILNFGHTYAHAIENYTKYKKFTHGEAVAYGMKYIFEYANKLGVVDKEYYEKSLALLNLYPFPNKKLKFNREKFISIMCFDKKNSQNKLTFILPVKKGEVVEFTSSYDREAKLDDIVL